MAKPQDAIEARFAFGENWRRFLEVLDEDRIQVAEESLTSMLQLETLKGHSFLDIGSGSGLFSLAAMRLGAERVHSFDYDPQSVACTRTLKERYFPGCDNWTIERGDVLDDLYVDQLGTWDVVYSWGVLHHTGSMWKAMSNAARLTTPSGTIFIAIYNDQGLLSRIWLQIKRVYNSGSQGRRVVTSLLLPYFAARSFASDVLKGQNPLTGYAAYNRTRGMSRVRDWHDWLGGYPFEVARPDTIFDFFRTRQFTLERIVTTGGRLGCNEFVFSRSNRGEV